MSGSWQNTVLKPESTITNAIESLNESEYGIVLITNKNQNLRKVKTFIDTKKRKFQDIKSKVQFGRSN